MPPCHIAKMSQCWHYIEVALYEQSGCQHTLATPVPTENMGSERSRFVGRIKSVSSLSYHCRRRSMGISNELFIITLLAWVMAWPDMDRWLKMTVQ